MVESLAQQKKNMRNILTRMNKKYGVVKPGNSRGDIEQCVFLILREGWDFRKAARAVKILVEHFVDWNEVRVSGPGELVEALPFLKYKDLEEKILRILQLLKEVYLEYNCLQLDFLKETDFEDTRKFFAQLEPLGAGNAYIFLQCLQETIDEAAEVDPPNLVISTEALRVGIRLGLIKRTSSHNVGRKAIAKLIGPKDYLSFQNLFVRHGDKICTSKSPLCKECFLNSLCKYYQSL